MKNILVFYLVLASKLNYMIIIWLIQIHFKTQLHIQKKCILTNREIEYLALASLGYKNIEIAGILSVSLGAVKKTLEVIYQKIHAKDRTNAVTIAFLHDIINIEILNFMAHKFGIEDFESRIK